MSMTLNEYQHKAMATCLPSSMNHIYMINGLTAEVGEINDKIAKAIRKGWIAIQDNNIVTLDTCPESFWDELFKEVGDCLWFIAGICASKNMPLVVPAKSNIDKLASRQVRGVIDGNGDNR